MQAVPTTSLTDSIRNVLREDLSADQKRGRPTLRQYARWCGCTQQLLNRFVEGKTRSLSNDILDTLAMLTGVYPAADAEEARWRRKQAKKWIQSRQLGSTHCSLCEFIRCRKALRDGLRFVREWKRQRQIKIAISRLARRYHQQRQIDFSRVFQVMW